MRKRILIIVLASVSLAAVGQTLEECQQAAERNYPLIRQYDLIEKTTALTVKNIQKGWLPQLSASAQVTYQSDVTAWPEQMQSMYQQLGLDMKGLTKDQYRIGLDLKQTVYDGGMISSQKRVAREQGKVQEAQNEVTLYQVRRRVNEMYFALLLLDEQILLNRDMQELLAGNERKLQSMVKGGTAAESDWQSVKAERLNVMQQGVSLEAQRRMLAAMLGAFCGMEVKSVKKPAGAATLSQHTGQQTGRLAGQLAGVSAVQRPEMRLYDAQLRLADAQEKALNAALRPKLGVFAQGFYGYPGLNMFEDMMSRKWSLNGLIGARLTWDIGAPRSPAGSSARAARSTSAPTASRAGRSACSTP